jgi:hypothetical protein
MTQCSLIGGYPRFGGTWQKPTDMFKIIQQMYGEEVMSKSSFLEWCKRYSERKDEVEFDSRPGRPTSKSDERVEKARTLIRNDRRLWWTESMPYLVKLWTRSFISRFWKVWDSGFVVFTVTMHPHTQRFPSRKTWRWGIGSCSWNTPLSRKISLQRSFSSFLPQKIISKYYFQNLKHFNFFENSDLPNSFFPKFLFSPSYCHVISKLPKISFPWNCSYFREVRIFILPSNYQNISVNLKFAISS